jgi:predicted nucleic acid-binding protein
MFVLVDTSIWSLALRKKDRNHEEEKIVDYFSEIIRELKLVIIGPIRQEILSGISDSNRYNELREKISVFEDYIIKTKEYEIAAQYHNECRKKGIQGSHIDYLICAVAINNKMSILTLDKDFDNYKNIIPIQLEKIPR